MACQSGWKSVSVLLVSAADHIRYLVDYGRGCLSLLDGIDDDLTDAGRALAQRLKEAL
ncbi:hypothetical protein OHA25_38955 [Nonomuraea sp. NBC_00507]|uniref:hypothetical protein n=1 Tax=Nonomuraea sp. NBC_00507 TaxID=2976002 RepID=UPI002E16CBE7